MYGLLLPEELTSTKKEDKSKPASDNSIQTRHQEASGKEPVMKRSKKMRNRKSAVYGDLDETDGDNTESVPPASDIASSPIHDMNVKLVSLSPEHSLDGDSNAPDAVLETRQGKVSELVRQFEEEEKAVESRGVSGHSVAVLGESADGKGKKRIQSNKAFDLFEKSGIIMGMVSFCM